MFAAILVSLAIAGDAVPAAKSPILRIHDAEGAILSVTGDVKYKAVQTTEGPRIRITGDGWELDVKSCRMKSGSQILKLHDSNGKTFLISVEKALQRP